jgi:hypothetical protein
MPDHAHELLAAAIEAHNRGATAAAESLFRALIEAYPQSPEALDAAHYLINGYRRRTVVATAAAPPAARPEAKEPDESSSQPETDDSEGK